MGGAKGMYNINASAPTIIECVFTQNAIGIRNLNSDANVSRCLFVNNGTGAGAAIFASAGELAVSDCVFEGNLANIGEGGAIHGGGINIDLRNSTFQGNSAGTGGALHLKAESTGEIVNCMFIDNSSEDGGSLYYSGGGFLVVSNCVFLRNSASHYGGAIYKGNSTLSISNATFLENEAEESGGAVWYATPAGTITNSVLWLNLPNQIVGSDVVVNYSDIHGGWDGPGKGNINAYPMFVDMAGGNLRLLEDSPCIDMGNNDNVPKDLIVDLDGNERIVDGDGDGDVIVDMGAYEYQGYPVCAEDMDGDGEIGPFDLAVVLGNWGFNPGHQADLDHDGTVGPFDLALLLGAWGPCE